jgi:hypothetical protein
MTDGAGGQGTGEAGSSGSGGPADNDGRDSAGTAHSEGSGAASGGPADTEPSGLAASDDTPAGGGDSASSAVSDEPEDHGAYAHATPEQLFGQVKSVRRQARRARHAYWFPLVLFGLLTCASVPFYIQHIPTRPGVYSVPCAGPSFWRSIYFGGFCAPASGHAAYYWLAAILAGLAATAVWYRLRGDSVGLRTPSRGYVITGLVLVVLALLIPVLAAIRGFGQLAVLMPGDLLIRGTFPSVLIGVGLCALAWVERSIALTVIAAGYLALSLVASLYDIENLFYDLGWTISPDNSSLPNVVLPALVLLLSGAGAWVVQRRGRWRPAAPAGTGPTGNGSVARQMS